MASQATIRGFSRGKPWVRKGIFRGNLCVEQTEASIIEIIQNLIDFALEGNRIQERLRQAAGLVVGFVLSRREVFKFLGGGN
jgi:hypothetical protein